MSSRIVLIFDITHNDFTIIYYIYGGVHEDILHDMDGKRECKGMF